jgi:ribosomal protein S18 acetylase RimI-like enzyme
MPITDRELARLGFEFIDPCFYMVRSADLPATPARGLGPELVLTVDREPDDDWLEAWAVCAELPESDRSGSFALVNSVSEPSLYVRVVHPVDGIVSVGRAVDTGAWRGMHNVATRADHRNAGIGTAVIRALETVYNDEKLNAYLQVEADSPAVKLYERLGYRIASGYHYRRCTGS